MATKKVKTAKNSTTPTTAVDPFAARVEPTATTASSERPVRPIKVIKAARPNVAVPVEAARPRISPLAKVSDAFAEVATNAAGDDQVTLELPADPPLLRKPKGRIATKPTAVATPDPRPRALESEIPPPSISKNARPKRAAVQRSTKLAVTSPTSPPAVAKIEAVPDVTAQIAATKPEIELSPIFKALADVTLPELPRENRARLQMQSPTRLYFYWTLRQNPWQQLRAVFGPDFGTYSLIVKLRNLTDGTEWLHPIETQDEWWFSDVEPGSEYAAEVGFYATNRPYFRLLYSNSVMTPRRSPSTHPATEARWTVSATKFAEVLDASGFTRDAVDVAIAGDDHLDAEQRTNLAFAELLTGAEYSTKGIAAEDMRHAMLALASGAKLDDLRQRVSSSLYRVLQANTERLTASGARKVLTEHFDVEETEWTEHEFGSAVFGGSLLNFPKTLRSRTGVKPSPRYNPVSSLSVGR